MTLTNAYCTIPQLEEWNKAKKAVTELTRELAISASSRGISRYCLRNFWLSASLSRLFAPDNAYEFDLGRYNDLTEITSLATDTSGDGTFETTWSAADYELLPLNPLAAPEAQPWTSIRSTGNKVFPFLSTAVGETGRSARVQITGKWGWPAIPDPVTQACLIKAARIFTRKDTPQGEAGWAEFGTISVDSAEDREVIGLLDGYRLGRKVGMVRIR